MSTENISKINKILQLWPPGTLATLDWFEKNSISQRLAYKYEESGWVERLAPGVYKRVGDKVDWQGGVYALQNQLNLSIHVGGKTALELKGLGHFIPANYPPYIYLFGEKEQKIRPWFLSCAWKSKIFYKRTNLFEDSGVDFALTSYSYPYFKIKISTPERAILELLSLVPQEQGIEEAMLIMEGLFNLRSELIENLLIKCTSIKVKRLFLALAEQCQLPWVKDINISKINLGHGKRVIIKNGFLDQKYQITLPKKGESFG